MANKARSHHSRGAGLAGSSAQSEAPETIFHTVNNFCETGAQSRMRVTYMPNPARGHKRGGWQLSRSRKATWEGWCRNALRDRLRWLDGEAFGSRLIAAPVGINGGKLVDLYAGSGRAVLKTPCHIRCRPPSLPVSGDAEARSRAGRRSDRGGLNGWH